MKQLITYQRHKTLTQNSQESLSEACANILNSPQITTLRMQTDAAFLIDTLLNKESVRRIVELPIRAASFIPDKYDPGAPKQLSSILCSVIGITGWVAWTCMDKVRDDQMTDVVRTPLRFTDHLALSSIMMSIMHSALRELDLLEEHHAYIAHMIGSMEQANCDEMISGRLHNLASRLLFEKETFGTRQCSAKKSMGAAIPLMAYMMKNRVHIDDIESCKSYFHHFILARQFSDDAYDWKEDLKKGSPTLVTEWMAQAAGGWKRLQKMSLKQQEKIFDERVSPKTAPEILRHAKRSIQYARKMTCFTSTEFLEELPRWYEKMAEKIIAEHKRTVTV